VSRAVVVFFDLDDTLLDDRGAQEAYLPQVYAAWRDRLPHSAEEFVMKWRAALQHHFDRHMRGELSYVAQRRERIRDVFAAPSLSDAEADARMREFLDAGVTHGLDSSVTRIASLRELLSCLD
jgi:putative hydrolase of the HAD superfamily